MNWTLDDGRVQPTSTVRVSLDKAVPWTNPEVSEELDECRMLHVVIILEMYYMSGLFVWSLITVTFHVMEQKRMALHENKNDTEPHGRNHL